MQTPPPVGRQAEEELARTACLSAAPAESKSAGQGEASHSDSGVGGNDQDASRFASTLGQDSSKEEELSNSQDSGQGARVIT